MSADKIEYDERLLATLTNEERAAIEGDSEPDERAALQELAGDDGDANAAPPVESNTDADPAAPAIEQPAGEDAQEPDAAAPDQATYRATLPDDYAQRVDALGLASSDLAQRFKEGEIEFDEYLVESSKISAQQAELTALKIKADIAEEMGVQSIEDQWKRAVGDFTTSVKTTIDYGADAAKQADLDMFVKTLAADAKNADKDFAWFLAEGHKRVLALHGIAADRPKYGDPGKPKKPDSRKPSIADLPKTLAHVAGGDGPGDVGNDEFSAIDNLDGLAFEDALASLKKRDPAAFARYESR